MVKTDFKLHKACCTTHDFSLWINHYLTFEFKLTFMLF